LTSAKFEAGVGAAGRGEAALDATLGLTLGALRGAVADVLLPGTGMDDETGTDAVAVEEDMGCVLDAVKTALFPPASSTDDLVNVEFPAVAEIGAPE
jgi:hypothetical protein